MTLTRVLEYSNSDIGWISFQSISNSNPDYIKLPYKSNIGVYLLEKISDTNWRGSPSGSFNAIAIHDKNMRLVAYHILDNLQNSGSIIGIWNVELIDDKTVEFYSPDIQDLTSLYLRHIEETDVVSGSLSGDNNPGISRVHSNLFDKIENLQTIKDYINDYTQGVNAILDNDMPLGGVLNTSTLYVRNEKDGKRNIELNEGNKFTNIISNKILVDASKLSGYCINEFGELLSYKLTNKKLFINFDTGTKEYTITTQIYNEVSSSKFKSRVEYLFGVPFIVVTSSGVPSIWYYTDKWEVARWAILPYNFCISGSVGYIRNGPKYPEELENYYWAISSALRETCQKTGKALWSSSVPLYSGENDAVFYKLLDKYISRGIVSNPIIAPVNGQEAIQFTVLKRAKGIELELTEEELYNMYLNSKFFLGNFKERSHIEAKKVRWAPVSNSVQTPKMIEDLPIDNIVCTAPDNIKAQVSASVWTSGYAVDAIVNSIDNLSEFDFAVYSNCVILVDASGSIIIRPLFPNNRGEGKQVSNIELNMGSSGIDYIYADNHEVHIYLVSGEHKVYNLQLNELMDYQQTGSYTSFHGVIL